MAEYGPETYGEQIADVYDDWYAYMADVEREVALLGELAGDGPVLELGVGTGRVAIPLSATGLDVHGIDTSSAMIERLRAKPGGDSVGVHIGDMADVDVDGSFSLVFVVFNTLFMLDSQDAQVRCFRNVAAHLAPGGRFLVHAFVPDLSRIEGGSHVGVEAVTADGLRLSGSVYDTVTQRFRTTQMRITEAGIRLSHIRLRYAFPPELDLMAQLAGLTLEHRWSSFDKEPFSGASAFAVSVYRA